MRRNVIRRVSLDALVKYLTMQFEPVPHDQHSSVESHTTVAIARLCAVDRNSVYRWQRQDGLPWYQADAIAIHLGTHPVLIWGEEWLDLPSAKY